MRFLGESAGGDVVKRVGAFISFRYLSKMDIARYQDYALGFCVGNKFEEAGALVRHVTPALHSFFPRDSLDTRHDDAYFGWFSKLVLQPHPLRFAKECA